MDSPFIASQWSQTCGSCGTRSFHRLGYFRAGGWRGNTAELVELQRGAELTGVFFSVVGVCIPCIITIQHPLAIEMYAWGTCCLLSVWANQLCDSDGGVRPARWSRRSGQTLNSSGGSPALYDCQYNKTYQNNNSTSQNTICIPGWQLAVCIYVIDHRCFIIICRIAWYCIGQ